jgi:23S rRNA (pseudouridine1915-N3)-methyltransferase
MKLTLAAVLPRAAAGKSEPFDRLAADYIKRATRYLPTESVLYDSEAALLEAATRAPNRPAAHLILLDSTGKLLTSDEFAAYLGRQRDTSTKRLLLAIGPPDGWSDSARQRAALLFSLGRITLPHQLARVVLAEQVYRALTILAGHPYHCGH